MVSMWNSFQTYVSTDTSFLIARLIFACRNVAVLVIMYMIKAKIDTKINNGELEEDITVERTDMNNDGKWLKLKETITVGEYDHEEWWKFVKQQGGF